MKLIQTIISKISLVSFISLISFVSLVSSCSKNDDFVDEGQSLNAAGVAIGGVSGYATSFENLDQQTRSGGALTRAWELPDEIKTNYVVYEGGYQPIAIAFTKNNQEPMMRYLIKGDEEWRISKSEGIAAGDYQLYGYIPHQTSIVYNITDYDGGETAELKNASYSTGAIMTLENVPSVMPEDLCVVMGAKHGYDKEHDGDNTDPRTNRLRQGDFTFKASGTPLNDYYFLLFDHLYAALRVRIKVHADYAGLRTIKLKSLQLDTQAGETKTTEKTKIIIKLKANDVNEDPIEELSFTSTGEVINGGLEFWSNSEGTLLNDDYQPFIGHFMADGITKLTLTSTYDVYDTKMNLIREGCVAVNSVLLEDLLTEQTATKRGNQYTINMTIKPTYLYVLSEPDLDNPTVKID